MFLLKTTLIWFLLRNLYFIDAEEIVSFTTIGCPSGWHYVPNVGSRYCYKVLPSRLDWQSATVFCHRTNAGEFAHAAMIPNAEEHNAIGAYLNLISYSYDIYKVCHDGAMLSYWTSGNRYKFDCKKPFVWSMHLYGPYLPMNYTAWRPNQPRCLSGGQSGVEVRATFDVLMNARDIFDTLCPLCQIERINLV